MVPKGWTEKKLSDLFEFKNGVNADKSKYGRGNKFINVMEVINKNSIVPSEIPGLIEVEENSVGLYGVNRGDVLFNRTSETPQDIGLSSVFLGDNQDEVVFGGFVIRARPVTTNLDVEFCKFCFRNPVVRGEIIKRGQGVIRANIGQGDLGDVTLLVPPLLEQKKISKLLSSWDKAIELNTLLIKKTEYKLNALIDVFIQEQIAKGTISFSEVFGVISERGKNTNENLNVLSVTQKKGVILRSESGRNIKTNSDDTGNYKVLRAGDFVLSLRSFEGGLEFSYLEGLISPAYTVLRQKVEINSEFYKFYFKSKSFLASLAPAIIGIRDGKQIDLDILWNIEIPYAANSETKSISRILNSYEKLLVLLKNKNTHWEKQKLGLMQQLLTGRMRVKV